MGIVLDTVYETIDSSSQFVNQYRNSKKNENLKIELQYDPDLPLQSTAHVNQSEHIIKMQHPPSNYYTMYNSQGMEPT